MQEHFIAAMLFAIQSHDRRWLTTAGGASFILHQSTSPGAGTTYNPQDSCAFSKDQWSKAPFLQFCSYSS